MTTFVSTSAGRGDLWTQSFSTAGYRQWCTQIKTALDNSGLVQTSDTGQLDPAAANVPGTQNTNAGYWIYRFNDARQGVDPIFLRVSPGRGLGSGTSRLTVIVGQGSNGSGTITGSATRELICGDNYTATVSSDPATTNYSCHTDGAFVLVMQAVPAGQDHPPRHIMVISRTRDQTTGAFDGRGVLVLHARDISADGLKLAFRNWTSGDPSASVDAMQFVQIIGGQRTTEAGEQIAWPHFYWDDGVIKTAWAHWTTHAANFPSGANTIDAAPYGTTRRWLAIGSDAGRCIRGAHSSSANWGMAVLWEAP